MADSIQPVFPSHSANIDLKVAGVFAFPEEWRTTDEANPGMFTYIAKLLTGEVSGGKVCPRELTEKQLREQQDKKKGGKKQAKKQDNPAEAEKLKEQMEKEQQEERKKLQEFNKLSEEEQFYHASEDCYKSAILNFESNSTQINLQGKAFVIFEEHVKKDGGEWVYFIKTPTANEEELAKLKKAKPKTLANANDLNPVVMRAWVNLSSLNSTTDKSIIVRSQLQQVDINEDSPKPALEKAYVKLEITLAEPLIKKPDAYQVNNIIKNPPEPPAVPLEVKCVEELKGELRIALESLAMEYSAMFDKDLNASQEQKLNHIFLNSRKNEPVRRKEQFLYDFNVSGKYRVLKERLKKVIVHLCESKFADKMEGAKSFTGVSCSLRDQFYSEIYNFLVTQYSETMGQLIEEKKQILNEVYVLKSEHQERASEEHLQAFIEESKQQRLQRIISEYLAVGDAQYGVALYQKQISKNPTDATLKYQYSLYCIKNNLKSVKDVLSEGFVDLYMQHHKEDQNAQLTYVLLLIASEEDKNLNRAWVILRELINADPKNVELLLFGAVLMQVLGKEDGEKAFLNRAEREQMRKLQQIKQEGKHQDDPQPSEIPSVSSGATFTEELSPEERDGLWSMVMNKFSVYGLINIVEKVKEKLADQQGMQIKKQGLKIVYGQGKYDQCLNQAEELFKSSKDMEIFSLLVNCLCKLDKLEEAEKYLKLGLKIGSQETKNNILLRLGSLYLQAQKFGNSKACMAKYLEKVKPSGGLSWQILGNAELKLGNYQAAINCFRFSNLSDPYNAEVWLSLAEAHAGLRNFIMVNQCLNSFEKMSGKEQAGKQKIKNLLQEVQKIKAQNYYDKGIKEKLAGRVA